jgi:hypothetical protein
MTRYAQRLVVLSVAASAFLLISASPALANDAPTCSNPSYTVTSGQPFVLPLDTCTDPDGPGSISYSLASSPSHGSITLVGGQPAYLSTLGYVGPDSFTYRGTDGAGAQSAVATVSITVNPGAPNDPPVCTGGNFDIGSGQILALPVCTDDNPGPLLYQQTSPPANGTFSASGGVPRYRSSLAYTGPDSVTFTATDGLGATSAPVTATINVDPSLPANGPLVCPDSEVYVPLGQSVVLFGNCLDPDSDPISYSLGALPTAGTLDILSLTSVRYTPNGSSTTDGFTYGASDGLHPQVQVNVSISVLAAGQSTFPPAPEDPSPSEPFVASVQTTQPGSVAIDERSLTTTPPTGYFLLGQEFDITAPPALDANSPLRITFAFDSTVPGSITPFRNGVAVQPCSGSPGVASPNPCFEPVVTEPDGDRIITVLTTHASIWNFGVSLNPNAHDFTGFFSPVDNRPTVNMANAGQSIPVKFSLGGDEGLDVFAPGYPKSQSIPCGTDVDVDGIESTLSPEASGLTYDPALDRYQFVWKTERSWAGTCRQLVLRFTDEAESVHRADFSFKAK